MSLLRLYIRVLDLLGKEARLGWILAAANLLLAATQFAEPVLFGRIVDVLSGKAVAGVTSAWPLLAAWAGFGLFTILSSAAVALHADRLAHRKRLAVMSRYFGHVLTLPLSFHGSAHSGRIMKIMISGTDALFRISVASCGWGAVSYPRDRGAPAESPRPACRFLPTRRRRSPPTCCRRDA